MYCGCRENLFNLDETRGHMMWLNGDPYSTPWSPIINILIFSWDYMGLHYDCMSHSGCVMLYNCLKTSKRYILSFYWDRFHDKETIDMKLIVLSMRTCVFKIHPWKYRSWYEYEYIYECVAC